MKPPKCRVCLHEHWPREPHVISDEPKVSELLRKPVANVVANNLRDVLTETRSKRLGDRHKDKEKRRGYQRLLMQTRRAVKAGKASVLR